MTLVMKLNVRSRTISADPFTATSSLVVLTDGPWGTVSGGGGIPAGTQGHALLIRESLQGGPRVRTASDPGVDSEGFARDDIVTIKLERKGSLGDTSALDGVEIIGQKVELWIVGESFFGPSYPISTDYTLSNPYVIAEGTVADGSFLGTFEGEIRIQPSPLPLVQPAQRKFSGRGPSLRFPVSPATARAEWVVYDPPGDLTAFVYFFFSLETFEAGGTQTILTNGDFKLQIVDSRLRLTVDYSTTDAVVTSPMLPRPEAWYRAYFTHDASEKDASLYLENQHQGTDRGAGTLAASGLSWVIGSNQTETSEFFRGFIADPAFFDALLDEETAEGHSDAIAGDETDLYAALSGLPVSATVLLDAAAAVNKGFGLVGLPSTGHGRSAGQIITAISGTTNYDATPPVKIDATTTTNEIVIPATYVAETFAGTETVTVSYATWPDVARANVNAGTPKNATIKGASPATSLGAGAEGGGSGSLAGSTMRRALGPVGHKQGHSVDTEEPVFLHGDPLHGCGFNTLHRGGETVTFTQVTSLLALYAATIPTGEAVAHPVLGVSRLQDGVTEGAVAADVVGESAAIRAGSFDGVDDYWDFGTSHNSVFTNSFTIILRAGHVPPSSGTYEILTNRAAAGAGVRIADEPDPLDPTFRSLTAQLHLPLSLVIELSWNYPSDSVLAYELAMIVERSGAGPVYNWTGTLLIDGIERDTFSSSWEALASVSNLYVGRNVAGTVFWEGVVSDLAIIDTSKSSAWVTEKSHDHLWFHPAGGADVVDEGDGTVTIPVHYTPYGPAETVTLSGFAAYSGDYILHADSTDTGIRITDTYTAETLTGKERIYDADIYDIVPGNWPDPGTTVYPASTVTGALGTMSASITGATWTGGVAPVLPAGVALYLSKHASEAKSEVGTVGRSPGVIAGQPGRRIDLNASRMTWPSYPLAVPWPAEAGTTVNQVLLDAIGSFMGGYYITGDGVMVFGREIDPYSASVDHTIPWEQIESMPAPVEQEEPPTRNLAIPWGAIEFIEEPGDLLEAVPLEDRNKWSVGWRSAEVPVPRVAQIWPTSSEEPPDLKAFWATRAGALAFAMEWREFVRYRRAAANPTIAGREWMFVHPGTGLWLKPFDVVQITHPQFANLGGSVKAQVWRPERKFGDHLVAVELVGIRLV